MDDRVEIIQRLYEHFFAGDIDGVMALCVPEVVVTQDPALPWGGRYEGRDGLIEFGMRLVGAIESKVTHEQLFRAGDQVVQQGRTAGTVRANGAAFDLPECHIWTFRDDDGLVVGAQFLIDSTTMLEALAR